MSNKERNIILFYIVSQKEDGVPSKSNCYFIKVRILTLDTLQWIKRIHMNTADFIVADNYFFTIQGSLIIRQINLINQSWNGIDYTAVRSTMRASLLKQHQSFEKI